MLTILGRGQQYCDRITRRSFLKVGGFTFGSLASLSLADLLRAEAATGKRHGHQAVINIFLAGGPPHQDLWDIKTEAPTEIRGEFKPIKTNVAGIQICEVFPKIAAMMDRFAVIRSVVGSDGWTLCGGRWRRASSFGPRTRPLRLPSTCSLRAKWPTPSTSARKAPRSGSATVMESRISSNTMGRRQ